MKMLQLLLVLLCTTGSIHTFAQPTIEWQQSFGGAKEEHGAYSLITPEGDYVLAGWSQSPELPGYLGNYDFYITKLDNSGSVLWQKNMGGTKLEVLTGLTLTHDGGYLMSGITESTDFDVQGNHGLQDIWLVKLDSDGNLVWRKTLGGSQYETVYGISATTDHGFILAGGTNSNDGDVGPFGFDPLYADCWFVKIDAAGEIEWQKRYGSSGAESGASIAQTPDGGYIALATSDTGNGDVPDNYGQTDIWVIRLDSVGELLWSNIYGGSSFDFGQQIITTQDGGFLVTAHVLSADGDIFNYHGGGDIWIAKMNALGAIQWKKTYGGSKSDNPTYVYQAPDGGYVMTGHSDSPGGDFPTSLGGSDLLLLKLNPNGAIRWQQSYGGESSDYGQTVLPTNDGGFIVSGRSYSTAGDVSQNNGLADLWFIKMNTFVSTDDTPTPSVLKLYPNPAIDNIRFDLPATETASLVQIFDARGVCLLTAQPHDKNRIGTGVLPNGLYCLSITTESGVVYSSLFQKVD